MATVYQSGGQDPAGGREAMGWGSQDKFQTKEKDKTTDKFVIFLF